MTDLTPRSTVAKRRPIPPDQAQSRAMAQKMVERFGVDAVIAEAKKHGVPPYMMRMYLVGAGCIARTPRKTSTDPFRDKLAALFAQNPARFWEIAMELLGEVRAPEEDHPMAVDDAGDSPPDMAAWIADLLADDGPRPEAPRNTDWAPLSRPGGRYGSWRYRNGFLLVVQDGYPRTARAGRRPWYATADGTLLLDPMANPFHRSEEAARACADTALLDGEPANWPYASMY